MKTCENCGYDITVDSAHSCAPRIIRPSPGVYCTAPKPEPSALNTQVAGDHYRKLGAYQPWEVLKRWLTPEEFRGYMKGNAIVYLAREQDKGGSVDVEKAMHTLQGMLELEKRNG